jgi:hypothetical protein
LLQDILEVLHSRGLVVKLNVLRTLPPNKEKDLEQYWTLSWQGCEFLKICHYCRRGFDSVDSPVVAQTMRIRGFGELAEQYRRAWHKYYT